jgi:NitT/TauT family transport system permease protein
MKKETWLAILSPVLFITIWQLLRWFEILNPYYIPGPSDVLKVFLYKLSTPKPDGSTLPQHMLSSVLTSLTGFLLAVGVGVPLGLFMGWKKTLDKAIRPIFDVFRQIPSPSWIPFSILWFGIGVFQRGFIVWQSAFVPAVINSYYGIRNVDEVYVNVAKVFGFSENEIFRKIYVPASLRQVFTGVVTAYGISWFVLAAAEMLAATNGLAYMIWTASRLGRSDLIVLGMLLIGFIGAGLTTIIRRVERYLTKYETAR